MIHFALEINYYYLFFKITIPAQAFMISNGADLAKKYPTIIEESTTITVPIALIIPK